MIEPDTIKLLRECDAGIKMGVSSIDKVLDYVHDEKLRKCLVDCKNEHDKLKEEIQTLISKFHDEGKEPDPMAKGMSWIKTNVKLAMDESDETIAELMTDGCNMGVKSLSRYLNQYKAADEKSKNITKRLIKLEEKLTEDVRPFL
ncbi:hypothetical protein [Parablautia muri]|uniref:DUF2383 domain-containing protein n=1 Tax=Parablautia muri TaxID=2320879 RepID=A0A9X5BF86_9FIRM|nr:hypothetical protein [Parablautia muri]NBJ92703.1 hypothetical protein [Parablautia muri]